MRVAITRAAPENARTAERVRARGGEAVLAPLLTIVPCGYDTNTAGAQAIIFTSSNGVRAFPDVRGARNRVVLAVGDVTAEAAREAGFTDVRAADGDVESLAALVHTSLDPAKEKLIHIAGDHVAGDLGGALRAAGFTVERRLAYASVAVSALPAAFNAPLDAVLFHSARAAETFLVLGAPGAVQLTAACFSQTIADAATAAPWKRLIVSPAPRDEALLDALFSG
ncbi:uroporphyrinogen-III synthase [Terricaulis silvestris]|uniref:Uroporphyrinogen-III synthase n=1 Tax=Terricaulis silvestris TaxID=2686094 RepID=A0A6I6MTZ9_9CAUL|nr:uroporphyrinogen-III synthase [Terricaulis silvestris]QGZ96858.1 uroporphyrinogen-III synthase [Terricaulis silvestris]